MKNQGAFEGLGIFSYPLRTWGSSVTSPDAPITLRSARQKANELMAETDGMICMLISFALWELGVTFVQRHRAYSRTSFLRFAQALSTSK